MAYPTQLRSSVFDAYGMTKTPVAQIAERFELARSTIYNWRARRRDTDSLERSDKFGGRHSKLDEKALEQLRLLFSEQPLLSLAALAAALQASTGIKLARSTISRIRLRFNLSQPAADVSSSSTPQGS